jgi:hypothetical protein
MSDTKPRRGRPKGTGIDDRDRLRDIVRLHEANPHKTPTTIIRSLGYTNPSTIRRLRDKYKLARIRAAIAHGGSIRPESGHHHHARPAPAFAGRSHSAN